ncbi:hypothetical protein CDV31_010542 [Fusarium ambrosium]|uniref:Major facilitator superfamily (MFS) profile domain-containing protein n=1 Tax=Fusarium ambrosium TaxID=131363 RepID=A0A428TML4_9HYPO|nr:hypothetical protein CDV31_010542 [Fusarium ambrosium]
MPIGNGNENDQVVWRNCGGELSLLVFLLATLGGFDVGELLHLERGASNPAQQHAETSKSNEAADTDPTINGENPNIVSWDGPDDPENPMNWSTVRKCINIGLMSLLTIISPLASSMFAPGVPKLMDDFNTNSNELATFVVSIYMFGYAFGSFSLLLFWMRESYAPVLLQRKAKRLRKETGNPDLRCELNIGSIESVKLAAVRPLKFLFATPIVFCIALYVDRYNFNEGQTGLSFLPAGLGMLVGVLSFGYIMDFLVRRWKKKQESDSDNKYKPEIKITPWLTVPTGLALPIGLFTYGWATEKQLHWIVPMIGVFVFSAGLLGTTITLQNYLVDSYPRYASSGSAATTIGRSLVGALMPLSGLGLYQRLGLGWGNSLLGFLSLILIPIPLILYFFGETIRPASRFYTPEEQGARHEAGR